MTRTYLSHCLKNDLSVRWPDSAMPISVFIAPFRWYEKSKQQESFVYRQMVLESLESWSRLSGRLVKFKIVNQLHDSQIDFKWRRVDRKSLGHCQFMINDQSLLYSAEVQIGISDGLLHARYNDENEVRHTILHEIGHALGLIGHSDQAGDIMYVPHQFGITSLSTRDVETLQWLYKLPPAFDYQAVGQHYRMESGFTFDRVLDVVRNKTAAQSLDEMDTKLIEAKESFSDVIKQPSSEQAEVLSDHHRILSTMGRFHLSTQNIQLSSDIAKRLLDKRSKPPSPPPGT